MSKTERISSLPDCLLHEILSSLTTKESVRTSVLSKRWINVWKSVPRLDLNASDFDDVDEFVNFTNSILHHNLFPEQLDVFNLTWTTCEKADFETIDTWIYYIISLKPKKVYINVSKLDLINSISCLFDCSTLEIMFLRSENGTFNIVNPTIINLPCLKFLKIGRFDLYDEFIEKLMLGCPILEELMFDDCLLLVTEEVRSSSLKSLKIPDSLFLDDTMLRISMPNLVDFNCGALMGHVSFENLESLEFAKLSLWQMDPDFDQEEVKLIRGLSNAKTIELSGPCVSDMLYEEVSIGLPLFNKLETLVLDAIHISKTLFPIDMFLDHSPNLKPLTLRRVRVERCEFPQLEGSNEIECGSLKTIQIERWSENDEEVDVLVEYLHLHLKGIENVSIETHLR